MGLHMNAVVWGRTILPSEEIVNTGDMNGLLKDLGFEYAQRFSASIEIPYYPNVTMGWDSSPRASQEDNFTNLGYPFMGTIAQSTPENFKQALIRVKDYMDQNPGAGKIFNINCWNEWTEGSYLEPDTINGMAYLEAIREVF